MPIPGMPNNGPILWPQRTDQERKDRIIGQVYGNIRIEHPEITREQVAQRLELSEQVNVEIVTPERR